MEQLSVFTRLLKLNLVEIEDHHALKDAVAMQRGGAVFIDTPGRNPFIDSECKDLHNLIMSAGGEAVLVLPAGLDANEAIDMVQRFKACGATRMLVTRLDMIRRMGSILRIAFDAPIAFANFSATSKVTEAPQPFNPVALARMVLPRQYKTEKAESQATGTHN
jgi:flagellar biosynthesis protein FlhF